MNPMIQLADVQMEEVTEDYELFFGVSTQTAIDIGLNPGLSAESKVKFFPCT